MSGEWTRLGQQEQLRCGEYRGVVQGGTSPDIARLIDDIESHRLAGLFLAVPTEALPVIRPHAGRLPVAGIVPQHVTREEVGDMVRFTMADRWLEIAVEYVASRGCRRVAVITASNQGPRFISKAMEVVASQGLETRTAWIQAVWPGQASWARHCVHLLFEAAERDRPDCLLITDDNLVEESVGGLVELSLRVPDEVHVVGHCNFPWRVPSVLPVKRLGYDIGEMLGQAIKTMYSNRHGVLHRHDIEMAVVWEAPDA
jgi:DNA-binding LacI/PurR family transcriptional regulator